MTPSDAGITLLFNLLNEEEEQSVTQYTRDFETFWKLYPASDQFAHYPKTRAIKINKKETFKAWQAECLKVGSPFLIAALTQEIKNREQDSGRTNSFTYMKGPAKWLNDQAYNEVVFPVTTQKIETDELL